MAYILADRILTRLRELTEDARGAVRAITSDRFGGGLHDGVSPQEQTRLGVLDEKPCEVSIVAIRPHPQRLTITGNVQLEAIDVRIKVIRTVAIEGQVDDDVRDEIKGLAAIDASALSQSLEWPANLATTHSGLATDLKALKWTGSTCQLEGTAGSAMRLTTIHSFTGTALSRPATV